MTRYPIEHGNDPRDPEVRLAEAEATLQAIRHGEIDAVVIEGAGGNQVYTLHSADEPYRILVEQMQDAAAVLTNAGDILYANTQFATLVATPLEAVLGSPIGRFVSVADTPDFEAFLATKRGYQRGRLLRADARTVDVRVSLSTTLLPAGDRLNLVISDLTDLLEAEHQSARADHDNRTKDEFLAMLAHELRTPLSAITTALAVIQMTEPGSGSAIRAREVAARQVAHISRLVTDLLDVERILSGKLRLDRRPLDMNQAVLQAVAPFQADVRFVWAVDLCATPVWAEVDAIRIEQVLANLLTNAVKYTPPGGSITVTVRAEDDEAVVIISDTGLGITPRLLPYIFMLNVQAERTLERAAGGLGIGLTLTRQLLELHGGTIGVVSEGDGQGSTFTVRLRRVPPVTRTSVTAPVPDRRAARRRVLLIEDSADAREMLRTVLELAGHEVYAAPDGIRGLELLGRVHPDVGIIDINLPIMDGYQIAERIRREPWGRDMLLLAVSGMEAPSSPMPNQLRGFDRHLVKPVDPDFLTRLLGELRTET